MNLFGRIIEPKFQIPDERKKFNNTALKALIMPILIEQILSFLVGVVDTFQISYIDEAAVSGVSLVNQLMNVFIMIFSALAAGGAVVTSQYIGSKNKEKGILAASQLVMIATLISFLLTAIAMIFGTYIFDGLFGKVENDVRQSGLTYFFITACSFPFLALYNSSAALFRTMSKTKITMNMSLAMNAINVIGNAVGVFVLKAGVAGVAYPTLISRAFASVVMIVMVSNKRNTVFVDWKKVFRWNTEMILRIFHIAIPNSIESGLFHFSKVALTSIVALFGTIQIAANGVAQSIWSMSAVLRNAIGPAFITVVGQYMGADDVDGADYYIKKLMRITFLTSCIWNLIFTALTPMIMKMYSLSDETIQLIITLVLIHNFSDIILGPPAFSLPYGLIAAGDAKYTMSASIFSTVVCRIAFSFLFCITFNMGVVGIAWAMTVDWVIKSILILARYRSGKWKNCKVI